MLRFSEDASSRFYAFLDFFIPLSIQRDAETKQRARMFLISHLFGPFLGNTITVYLYLLENQPGYSFWILTASITFFWLFPFALRLGVPFGMLGVGSVQNLIFAILWGSYNYGGISSPFLPWLLTVPLLAFFYLGTSRGARVIVLALIGFNLAAFYMVYLFGQTFPQHIPLSRLSGIGLISTLCAAIYVSMMALYYGNVVASQTELEHEVIRDQAIARQFREAKAEAERANQAKSEFLAKISHELRTPLNAVIGYSEMLIEEAEASNRHEQGSDLRKIRDAGKHLLALISDILDLSKLEAGKMEVYNQFFEVAALIDDIVGECRESIAAQGNQLFVQCGDDLGSVSADGSKLRQAVMSLLSNAAKFTRNGEVILTVSRRADRLIISVRDTGVGITPNNMNNLFQNFGAAEEATASKYGGTGLGLALSRKLCRLMGGDISVESEAGKGSCFTIDIPVQDQANAATSAREPEGSSTDGSYSGARGEHVILVVDDDPTILDLVARTLAKEGFCPVTAVDARSGLRLARETKPAVVVLDVQMPDIDGWELINMFAADPELHSCPVVLLTVEDDLQKGREHGVAHHLVKPIDREQLLAAVSRLCHGAPPAAAPSGGPIAGSEEQPAVS